MLNTAICGITLMTNIPLMNHPSSQTGAIISQTTLNQDQKCCQDSNHFRMNIAETLAVNLPTLQIIRLLARSLANEESYKLTLAYSWVVRSARGIHCTRCASYSSHLPWSASGEKVFTQAVTVKDMTDEKSEAQECACYQRYWCSNDFPWLMAFWQPY